MAFDFNDFSSKAQKALEHFSDELSSLRTGRATAQLLDPVVVEAYGSKLKIHEVATVSAPDAQLLVVTPWDKGLLSSIEKAIAIAGLNLNPVVSGDIIRIVVPALTQERRQEMVKILHQKAEGSRVMIRNIRTDTKKEIDKLKGQAGVSEDDIQADHKTLDEKIKECLDKIDQLTAAKEKELMTI